MKDMEKAKQIIQEQLLENTSKRQKDIEFEAKMNNLKSDINNLLHTYLPGDITLDEADALAMCINDIIWNPRTYLTAPQGGK